MRKVIFGILFILLSLSFNVDVFALPQFKITQLTDNVGYDDYAPRISDDDVVWKRRQGEEGSYLYELFFMTAVP